MGILFSVLLENRGEEELAKVVFLVEVGNEFNAVDLPGESLTEAECGHPYQLHVLYEAALTPETLWLYFSEYDDFYLFNFIESIAFVTFAISSIVFKVFLGFVLSEPLTIHHLSVGQNLCQRHRDLGHFYALQKQKLG